MVTKLEAMRSLAIRMRDAATKLQDLAEEANHEFDLCRDEIDAGPIMILSELEKQIRIGSEYSKEWPQQYGWCEEHSTNYTGKHCNFGEHRQKL
jgi:hypothetical protein